MARFCIDGTSGLGKTTFIKGEREKFELPTWYDVLTDYEAMCANFPIFKNKTEDTAIAALYNTAVEFLQRRTCDYLQATYSEDVYFFDRFPWTGLCYELIFKVLFLNIPYEEKEKMLDELAAPIIDSLGKLAYDLYGMFLINSDEQTSVAIITKRTDFMDRKNLYNVDYIKLQNRIFEKIGKEVNIPVFDLAKYMANGEEYLNREEFKNVDVLSKQTVRRVWNKSFLDYVSNMKEQLRVTALV